MNEELKWLAENIHVWPQQHKYAVVWHENIYPKVSWDSGTAYGESFTYAQWQAARDELSGKPSWDDVPKWVNWMAQWSNGEWIGYEVEPERGSIYDPNDCYVDPRDNPRLWYPGVAGEVLGGWRNTLERRPENNPLKHTEKVWRGSEDGLPPVGTKCICEYYSSGLNKHTATIVAYADNRVWVDLEGDSGDSQILYVDETNFKSLPTEEDKTVEKMLRIMEGGLTEVAARALYRVGLRFTEQTK